MKSSEDGAESKSMTTDAPPPEFPERSSWERWKFRGVIILLAGLVCAVIGQTIGRDLIRMVRRLPMFRSVARSASVDLAGIDSPLADRPDPAIDRINSRSKPLAGDALIAVPRGRKGAGKSVEAPPEPANDKPLEALPVENKGDEPVQGKMETTPEMAEGTPAAVDFTETLLEAAARLVSLSWQDFDYPVTWSAPETSKSRMVYVSRRNRLFRGAAYPHPTTLSLDQFRKDYAQALSQFPDDPRLDYAFGLVLWKHGQFAEAIEMFQIAARLNETPFLPAALAVAWGRFLTHEDRRGLDQLAHVARLLATHPDKYPTDAQAEQAAVSIGRALGYLSRLGQPPETVEMVELTTRNILERLPQPLRDSCEAGRIQIGQRESELLQLASLPHDSIAQGQQRKNKELNDKIDELRKEMKVASDVLVRNHRTHVESVQEILRGVTDVRGKMDKLRPMIEQMKQTIQYLAEPIGHLEVIPTPPHYIQSASPTSQTGLEIVNGNISVIVNETPSERAARVAQLTKARNELKKIEGQISDLRDQQRELVASRNEADAKAKLEKDQIRRVRRARLGEQKDLETKLETLTKALRRVSSLRAEIDTIAAFVPWNVEVEGEALRQAFTSKTSNSSR